MSRFLPEEITVDVITYLVGGAMLVALQAIATFSRHDGSKAARKPHG
jgi:hypothetical protein